MTRVYAVFIALLLGACSGSNQTSEQENKPAAERLVHSFAIPGEAKHTHLHLDAEVDFDNKQIKATATYSIEAAPGAKRIILDIKGLSINAVKVDGQPTDQFWIGEKVAYLGQPLEIAITDSVEEISVAYHTSPDAAALQWLMPQQTAGKKHPFLFTQSQAILARTWIPCQDSPGIRYTYEATIKVPAGLMAVMSASNPVGVDSSGVYHFEMKQRIPSYLMALAVGDLNFREVGNRTGVYAEPSVIAAAAYEFEDMQKMLEAAEEIYGAYAWDRYDVIVLPPSFPFGGMENPRLTFATPTILAGDKSLTALVAHELAHSWSGNLVTNRTWNDFWLNEGFTVYFERRIMEAVYGKEYADMLTLLGKQDLDRELVNLADVPDDTRLKLSLEGRDPDDGMSDIAYEKGFFLLRTIEENVGRTAFDSFLNKHFKKNAFSTITTEEFLSHLKQELLGGDQEKYDALMIDEWVYEPGIPTNMSEVSSSLFDQVNDQIEAWKNGGKASDIETTGWTTHQWLHFLRHLSPDLTNERMKELDKAFGFTQSGNSELAAEWFVLAIRADYHEADAAIDKFLIEVGRRKFLVPIYKALIAQDPTLERAKTIYGQARPNYHSVATSTLDALLKP
ncbi:MAG: M1 family metallopeptidase [Cryomorphaceae bacterium]